MYQNGDRPSPGSFIELQQVITSLGLTPGALVAVILDTPAVDPFNGPRAMLINGISPDGVWGEMEFTTIAFRDRDFLIQILHAVGIHVHIDTDANRVLAETGPAAGEPDKPRLPIPPIVTVVPERPEPEEVIVAEAPATKE